MTRTDTAVRVINASPDRTVAALTDADAPADPLTDPQTGHGRRFRSAMQCERPARRPSRAPGSDDEGCPAYLRVDDCFPMGAGAPRALAFMGTEHSAPASLARIPASALCQKNSRAALV